MAIGPNRKPADFEFQPYPLDFISRMGQYSQKQHDDNLDKIDKVTAGIAGLLAAPGHEDLVNEVSNEYKAQSLDLINKSEQAGYKNLAQDTRRFQNQFINDPRVKTIVSSKDAYDKNWRPVMNDPKNKSSIYQMPTIMDARGNFKQNKENYGNLNYVPYADFNKAIDDELKKVEHRIAGSSKLPVTYDLDGNLLLKQGDKLLKVREMAEFKRAIPAIANSFMDAETPEARALEASTNANAPGSYNRNFVTNFITNKAIPLYNTQYTEQDRYTSLDDGKDKDDDNNIVMPDKSPADGPLVYDGGDNASPTGGISNNPVVQEIGNGGVYTSQRQYSDKSNDKDGTVTKNRKTIYNAQVDGYSTQYLIDEIVGDVKIPGKPGALLTYGDNSSVGIVDQNTAVNTDPKTDRLYIDKTDDSMFGSGKMGRVYLKEAAVRDISGTDTKEGTDKNQHITEFLTAEEAMTYLGKEAWKNTQDRIVGREPNNKGKIKINTSPTHHNKLMNGYKQSLINAANTGAISEDQFVEEMKDLSTYKSILDGTTTLQIPQMVNGKLTFVPGPKGAFNDLAKSHYVQDDSFMEGMESRLRGVQYDTEIIPEYKQRVKKAKNTNMLYNQSNP